jgi:glycosyltransferase involved in cell wall biosynthesis
MRVLFINRFFYPDQSATARLVTDLAEELVSRGFGVTVVTSRMSYLDGNRIGPHDDCYRGVTVRRVWSTRFGRRFLLGRLADYATFYVSASWAVVRSGSLDCVVALSDPPLLSALAAILHRLKGGKTICWLQDVFPENAIRAGLLKEGWLSRILIQFSHWSLRASDQIIVVGRCMERQLNSAGLPRHRITCIPNWADGECLTPVPAQENWFRKEYGLDERLIIMYSGNLGLVHDHHSLLRVIRALRSMPEVRFVFMGYGSGKERLEQWARREEITNLKFIEYQTRQHLRYSLSAGDIHLVSLRSDMEGLSVPSKVYGIMAVGRPVMFIGPEGSEVAAVIREARCGEVFDPAESEKAALVIRDLSREPERRRHLGAAGRRYFESVLEKRLAMDRFQAVFRNMVG